MQFFDLFGRSHDQDMKQLEVIHDALNSSPEVEVFPLQDIPVECEDAPVHDGTWPCGDPDCPCATYGYGVPSLSSPAYPGQCDDCPGRSHPLCCWNTEDY